MLITNKVLISTSNKDDIYVLEQQLLRKQHEITLAQEQLKQTTSLSRNVS